VLVGARTSGDEWTSVARSESPNGPWKVSYGSGGVTEPENVTPLGIKTLTIGDRSFECDVMRSQRLDDSSLTLSERWTDRATGLELLVSQTTRPRDADAPPSERKLEQKAVGFETRTVNGQAIDGIVVEGSQSFSGERPSRTRMRWVISAKVPAQRLYSASWSSPDAVSPSLETELVAFGRDDAVLAEQRSALPPATPRDFREDFESKAFAEADSADPKVRAHGISTLGMNKFQPAQTGRIEKIVRAGLNDANLDVRRQSAVAAGWHKLPGTTSRIIEIAQTDPSHIGDYLSALCYLADPVSLDFILSFVPGRNGFQSEMALRALVNFTDDRAYQAIVVMSQSAETHQRVAVARALARGVDPRGIDLLICAASDPQATVRSTALISLRERKDPRGMDVAIAGMDDADPTTRSLALAAVAQMGAVDASRAREAIYPCLSKAGDASWHTRVLLTLAQLKDPRVLPELRELASSTGRQIDLGGIPVQASFAGVNGLIALGTPEALTAVFEIARKPERTDAVLSALRTRKSPEAARAAWEAYVELIKTPDAAAPKPSAGPGRSIDIPAQFLSLVPQSADASLRDEIDAAIPGAPVRRRPELRRTVRMINEQLARQPQ
jgi:HEAT repeat protein